MVARKAFLEVVTFVWPDLGSAMSLCDRASVSLQFSFYKRRDYVGAEKGEEKLLRLLMSTCGQRRDII